MFKGLAEFVQFLLDAVVLVLNTICSLFPPSPFTIAQNSAFSGFIAKINYFVPVYEFVSIMEAWLVAVTVYYAIAIVARWLKAID